VERVGEMVGRPARLVTGSSFDQLTDGEVDAAFICGLPYVRLTAEAPSLVSLLAAPVLTGDRYQGRPIYFSDVVVRADSGIRDFEGLRGCRWAYNEPDSHSGHLLTLYQLVSRGHVGEFFGEVVRAGFHQHALRMVMSGEVDASAIDSQVLEVELRRHPGLRERLRVIDTFGPSTIQPLVASTRLAESSVPNCEQPWPSWSPRMEPGKLLRAALSIVWYLSRTRSMTTSAACCARSKLPG
jgi:phosphonate transport system substrate-binding protein